ncbi:MAG TPA: helix-turn-helix domain-containing protein, partial [Candidatus Thalassarchaeaceae archaeon]|nr:helix-turn-helix domain-containing protein [Candidatus Thalassarchaeaceae archaeon]
IEQVQPIVSSIPIPTSFGPVWEPDLPFDPLCLHALTEAERMVLEASMSREVSPSDQELQARLEVGRSRLSQIYNGMRRKGLLSVRKQGRTRYFKLSDATGQHLRRAAEGVV